MSFLAMARISFLRDFLRPSGRSFLLVARRARLAMLMGFALCGSATADDIRSVNLAANYSVVRESVVEAIEGAGLVVATTLPFNTMLARTAADLGRTASPYANAEIIQFCSSRLAWQLVEENAGQAALCPLSITVYSLAGEAGATVAYRSPGRLSPARAQADDLLRDLVSRARQLAGQ